MHKELFAVPTHTRQTPAAVATEAYRQTNASVAASKSDVATAFRTDREAAPLLAMQLLRIDDICQLLRISKPTFWRLRRRADFPQPTAVTDRVIGWYPSEIRTWLDQRRRTVR